MNNCCATFFLNPQVENTEVVEISIPKGEPITPPISPLTSEKIPFLNLSEDETKFSENFTFKPLFQQYPMPDPGAKPRTLNLGSFHPMISALPEEEKEEDKKQEEQQELQGELEFERRNPFGNRNLSKDLEEYRLLQEKLLAQQRLLEHPSLPYFHSISFQTLTATPEQECYRLTKTGFNNLLENAEQLRTYNLTPTTWTPIEKEEYVDICRKVEYGNSALDPGREAQISELLDRIVVEAEKLKNIGKSIRSGEYYIPKDTEVSIPVFVNPLYIGNTDTYAIDTIEIPTLESAKSYLVLPEDFQYLNPKERRKVVVTRKALTQSSLCGTLHLDAPQETKDKISGENGTIFFQPTEESKLWEKANNLRLFNPSYVHQTQCWTTPYASAVDVQNPLTVWTYAKPSLGWSMSDFRDIGSQNEKWKNAFELEGMDLSTVNDTDQEGLRHPPDLIYVPEKDRYNNQSLWTREITRKTLENRSLQVFRHLQ